MQILEGNINNFDDLVALLPEEKVSVICLSDDAKIAKEYTSSLSIELDYESFLVMNQSSIEGIELPKQMPVVFAVKGYSFIASATMGVDDQDFGAIVTHLA